MVKLFVGGFPLETDELALVQLISPFATVSTIKIVRDKKTGICKGYAFVEVTDEIGAQSAMYELNNTEFRDRELTLNIVPEEPPKPPPRSYPKFDRNAPVPERKKRPRKPM
jgi:RNA recognition motif-containing protein